MVRLFFIKDRYHFEAVSRPMWLVWLMCCHQSSCCSTIRSKRDRLHSVIRASVYVPEAKDKGITLPLCKCLTLTHITNQYIIVCWHHLLAARRNCVQRHFIKDWVKLLNCLHIVLLQWNISHLLHPKCKFYVVFFMVVPFSFRICLFLSSSLFYMVFRITDRLTL